MGHFLLEHACPESSYPPSLILSHFSSSLHPPSILLSPSLIPSSIIIDWSIFRRILRASAPGTDFHLLSHGVGVSHLWLAGCRCRWTIRKHGISSISVISTILLLIFVSRWSFYTSHYCYLLIWQDIIVFFATYFQSPHTVTRLFSILMSTISHWYIYLFLLYSYVVFLFYLDLFSFSLFHFSSYDIACITFPLSLTNIPSSSLICSQRERPYDPVVLGSATRIQ